jgi:hypothetical protein
LIVSFALPSDCLVSFCCESCKAPLQLLVIQTIACWLALGRPKAEAPGTGFAAVSGRSRTACRTENMHGLHTMEVSTTSKLGRRRPIGDLAFAFQPLVKSQLGLPTHGGRMHAMHITMPWCGLGGHAGSPATIHVRLRRVSYPTHMHTGSDVAAAGGRRRGTDLPSRRTACRAGAGPQKVLLQRALASAATICPALRQGMEQIMAQRT